MIDEKAPARAFRRSDFLKAAGAAGLAAATTGGLLEAAPALANGHPGGSGKSLAGHLTRISHVVCNVSDLERAREFWERWTPMRMYARTQTPRQRFRGLGIRSGQFDGYLMRSESDPGSPLGGPNYMSVHLVQWQDPAPVGVPYDSPLHVGWYRLCFAVEGTLAETHAALVAGGVTPYVPYTPDVAYFGIPDPDGITIEYIKLGNSTPRPTWIANATPNVQRDHVWYTETLGLNALFRATSCQLPNWLGPHPGTAAYDTVFMQAGSDPRLAIDFLEWSGPGPNGESEFGAGPNLSFGKPYREPNHLGYVRLAFEVDDIDACYDILRRSRPLGKAPGLAGPPEEWDLGPDAGTRRVLILNDPRGVGIELIERPPLPDVSTSPPAAC